MKHRKYAQTIIKSFLFLIVPLISLALILKSTDYQLKADEEDVVVTPKFKPTKDPKKFLGIWLTSGYDLQPKSDYYTTVDTPVTVRTNTGRSVWAVLTGIFDGIHFRWWETPDGSNWSEVDKSNNGQKKNFTVTPTEVGTTWYQLDTQFYTYITWYLKTHLYSQVTAVHVLSEAVDATDLEVTVDDDYLYNTSDQLSNTTYAHAKPTPINATGDITWSIDRPDLATIDEDGQITANSQGNSGMVVVTGTLTNSDGSKIYGTKSVEIGGGLDDQTVKSGTTATYTLKGNTGGDGDDDGSGATGTITIDWYEYSPGSNNKAQVATGDSTAYTTDTVNMDDDQSYYQAVITLKSGKVTKTITTNKAKLTVIPSGEPDIDITNTINNKTYTDADDTDLQLNKVINGDNVAYHNELTNQSSDGILKNGYYVLPLRSGTMVNQVEVNGQALTDADYTTIADEDNNADDLVIDFGSINNKASVTIDVDTTVQNVSQNDTFKATPYVYGTNNDGNIYRREATNEVIYFLSNQLETSVQNINYGTVAAYSKNVLNFRPDIVNAPNNIVDVADNRRDKRAVQVYVSQDNDFVHEDSGTILPADLRYYSNGSHQSILNNKTLIASSDNDKELAPINWQRHEGLLLYLDTVPSLAGNYSTTLNWHFEDSI